MNEIKVMIQHKDKVYEPVVKDNVVIEWVRQGTAGKIKFSVIKDGVINFSEGDAVSVKLDNTNLFFGFVFTKKRTNKNVIDVVAYDQLRYLKNKDTYVYENKTASELIKMIAGDFRLKTGVIEDTAYKIPSMVEDNEELFQMIQNALNVTLDNKNKVYVLYDDFGKITLKSLDNMIVPIMIDDETMAGYSYQSSIDKDTYNKIKLVYDNEEKGEREVYIAKDSTHINQWGVLQKYDTIKKDENGKVKADTLLALHNKKTRKLQIKDALGDIRVRAGSLIYFKMELGDINMANLMLVEKCTHTFKKNQHLMNLTLKGGDFVG